MLKHYYGTHAFAVADHSVIFARYSQHRHLQDALEELEDDFKDVVSYSSSPSYYYISALNTLRDEIEIPTK